MDPTSTRGPCEIICHFAYQFPPSVLKNIKTHVELVWLWCDFFSYIVLDIITKRAEWDGERRI